MEIFGNSGMTAWFGMREYGALIDFAECILRGQRRSQRIPMKNYPHAGSDNARDCRLGNVVAFQRGFFPDYRIAQSAHAASASID